ISKAPNDVGNSFDKYSFTGSTWAAERHVANKLYQPSASATFPTPYTNEASNTTTNFGIYVEPAAINYQQCGLDAGLFPGDKNVPGIDPSNYPPCDTLDADGPNSISMAATIKFSMAAGLYRMGVRSDDGFKVTVGTNTPPTDLLLGIYDSTRSGETTFDFVVASAGIYNFRLLYSEVTGPADVEWYWINRATGAKELVRPLALESAASVGGPYSVESAAV